ncbi:MAG: S49 family peptidase [Sulfuriferula sp.]
MKRALLISEFLSTPWALMPERLNAFAGVLGRWMQGESASDITMAAIQADKQSRTVKQSSNTNAGGGNIAVLPFYGVVTQRGNMVDDISGTGSASTQRFTQSFRDAMADPSVSSILIDIDSPGGSVYGVAELANEIQQTRGQKNVVAIANSLAASAAYWIGCAANEFYITPGGEVGSIGVWQAHEDWSAAMTDAGVKTTLISAGKFKVEGNPYQPLDEEAQAFMQSRVDDYYVAFTKAVAKGRSMSIDQVRNGMGQGRCLGADAALSENMVDGIMTFDDVVKKMQRDAKSTQRGASRLAAAKRELEIIG